MVEAVRDMPPGCIEVFLFFTFAASLSWTIGWILWGWGGEAGNEKKIQ